MSKKIIYFGSIAFFILCSSKIVAQCTLKNGIYVNSSTKGHTIEWQSSNGNNGMGEFIISLTEKFINKKGNLQIKEFNNQADENLDFEFDRDGFCKIIFKGSKIKYFKITSNVSFISDDGCKWSLLKKK
jgi:hypothetical protein